MIFTALSPNTQRDDFKVALKFLFQGDKYLNEDATENIKKWFRDFFQVPYVATYESARTALYFVLKKLGIGKGDKVAVQAFTCVAAVNPIKWTEADPLFIDINQDNFNIDVYDLENKLNGKTKAIIFQHTFGCPAGIEDVVKLARSKGIYVIEDCAHIIGGEYKGRKVGTFGDFAIFSLGRDKAISASFGGICLTRRKIGSVLVEGEKFLSPVKKKWVFQQVLYTVIAYLTRKLYDSLLIGKAIHFTFLKTGLINKATTYKEKKEGEMPDFAKSYMPNAFAMIALNQLKKLDKLNERRYEISRFYFKELKKLKSSKFKLPKWSIEKKFYPLRFPLLVKNRDSLVDFAEKRGVSLGKWYDTPVAPREVDLLSTGYRRGSCPKAEEVCDSVINLPIHINLSNDDTQKVIEVIKSFYKIK